MLFEVVVEVEEFCTLCLCLQDQPDFYVVFAILKSFTTKHQERESIQTVHYQQHHDHSVQGSIFLSPRVAIVELNWPLSLQSSTHESNSQQHVLSMRH